MPPCGAAWQARREGGRLSRFERNKERLLTPKKALRLLQETADGSGWQIDSLRQIEVVKDWPDRRLTVRLFAQGRCAHQAAPDHDALVFYGKLFRSRRGESSYARHRAAFGRLAHLSQDDDPNLSRVRLPEPIGYHAHRRFVLMAELPGRNLGDALHTRRNATVDLRLLERTGRMIATLHRVAFISQRTAGPDADHEPLTSVFATHAAKEEIEVLDQARTRLSETDPPKELRQRYLDLHAVVVRTLRGSSPGRWQALLHRDFYPHQVILSANGDGLIDLDELALAPPELDVGNFIAHLLLDDLRRPAPDWTWQAGRDSFLQGYAGQASLRPNVLTAYTCSALLRLACLRRLAGTGSGSESGGDPSGWIDLAGGLLEWGERILAGRGRSRSAPLPMPRSDPGGARP